MSAAGKHTSSLVLARAGLALAVMLLFILFPLRIALTLGGAERLGLNARAVAGTIWWGGLGEARIGQVPLGTLETRFAPSALLKGQLAIDFRPYGTGPTRLSGRLAFGIGGWKLTGLTGTQSADWIDAPLPVVVEALNYRNTELRFSQSGCRSAEGIVEAVLPAGAGPVVGRLACVGGRPLLRLDLPGQAALALPWPGAPTASGAAGTISDQAR